MGFSVIVSIYVLLHFGSLCFAVNPIQLYKNYRYKIRDNEMIMNGNTAFCQLRKAKIWMMVCKHTFKNLRKRYPEYQETYLHYKTFTDFNAMIHICSMQPVQLEERFMETPRVKNIREFSNNYINEQQHLTICFASPIIVPKGTSPAQLPIYNSIAISVVPTNNEELVDVMVFVKSENHYMPLDWFRNVPLKEPQQFDPQIFKQDPPTSQTDQEELYQMVLEKVDVLKNKMIENIVYLSDAEMFTRLCILVMRGSQYPQYDEYITKFSYKPKPQFYTISVEVNNKSYFITIVTYSCTSTKINDLNEEYYLSPGVDYNSVTVYKKTKPDTKEPKSKYTLKFEGNSESNFELVEMISNVTSSFLNEIDIPRRSYQKKPKTT